MRVKEESEKAGLKLNTAKTKIMASGPIDSWQMGVEKVEAVKSFIFLDSKITEDGDCSHEIKKHFLWRRKWQPTPLFLPGESRGQRNLEGYSPRGLKESDTSEPLSLPLHGMIFKSKLTVIIKVSLNIKKKKHFLLGRKTMTNLDIILKSRDISLLTKVCIVRELCFFK